MIGVYPRRSRHRRGSSSVSYRTRTTPRAGRGRRPTTRGAADATGVPDATETKADGDGVTNATNAVLDAASANAGVVPVAGAAGADAEADAEADASITGGDDSRSPNQPNAPVVGQAGGDRGGGVGAASAHRAPRRACCGEARVFARTSVCCGTSATARTSPRGAIAARRCVSSRATRRRKRPSRLFRTRPRLPAARSRTRTRRASPIAATELSVTKIPRGWMRSFRASSRMRARRRTAEEIKALRAAAYRTRGSGVREAQAV